MYLENSPLTTGHCALASASLILELDNRKDGEY